jgi:hypothetical protein
MRNKIVLPKLVDLTPSGEIVSRAGIGEDGYADNFECTLSIRRTKQGNVKIMYYCEDGYFLSEDQVEWIINNRKSLI